MLSDRLLLLALFVKRASNSVAGESSVQFSGLCEVYKYTHGLEFEWCRR